MLESVACRPDVRKLGPQIGFTRGQTLDVSAGGLIVQPGRIQSRFGRREPLFERRAF
jgi:hypothetical protein